MAHAYSPKDAAGGSSAPAARLHVKAADPFKERAERQKAARDGGRIGAAPRVAVTKTTRTVKPVLKLVTTTVTPKTTMPMTRLRPPAHKTPLVLVASASDAAVTDADFAELPNQPAPEKAYRGKRVRGGGGGAGGGGAGGGGAGVPPEDRVFNQDDLAGVLMTLALLLLIGLYFAQGAARAPAPAAAPQRLVSTAAAPAPPPAVPAPLVDPYGDAPVDLKPKSPPPVAQAAPAAAPAPACPQGRMMRAWFCTAKSVLTDAAKTSLEKDLADWAPCITGKQLVVTGYADTRGASEYNVTLSTARASAVAEALRAKGAKVSEAAGAGELPGLTDGENCANQRRVDVRLSDDPTAPPPSPSCAPPEEFAALSCG